MHIIYYYYYENLTSRYNGEARMEVYNVLELFIIKQLTKTKVIERIENNDSLVIQTIEIAEGIRSTAVVTYGMHTTQ